MSLGAEFPLMMIEGFYGRPWKIEDRISVMRSLSSAGFHAYLYAPKADPYLREKWQEPYSAELWGDLRKFAQACSQSGMKFGLGLSPMGLHHNWDLQGRGKLRSKILELAELDLDFLAILFDDMKGDFPHLARTQAEICDFVFDLVPDLSLLMCPSYYSPDPVLDLVFGRRPENYLEELGRYLDPKIEVFWTGNRVCSPEIRPKDLELVTQQLGRKPFLWDNEPVNDGVRLAPWLNFDAFGGRDRELRNALSGHGTNPMVEPHLSALVQSLLPRFYQSEQWDAQSELKTAFFKHLPPQMAEQLWNDHPLFTLCGVGEGVHPEQYLLWSRRIFTLENWELLSDSEQELLQNWQTAFEQKLTKKLSEEARQNLLSLYAQWDHPAAQEICAYLRFEYAFDPNCLT